MTKATLPKPHHHLIWTGNGGKFRAVTKPRIDSLDVYVDFQMEAYAAAKVREALNWISVDDRLPDKGLLVLVYSPPQPGDWPDSIRIEFDFIDPDSDDPCWHNHSEHYEHCSCVAKGGSDVEWTGPSEKAPYTHWMPLPPPPQHDNE